MLQSDALHGIIPWIDGLSFVGIAAGVAKGSDWLDSMLNDAGRVAITKWLKNVPPDVQDDSWPVALSGLIDRVFGERPFSLKFIARSFIASFIAVCLVFLLYIRLHLRKNIDLDDAVGILEFSLSISLIPDYFSLLVSRSIIMLIPRNPRLWRIVFLLIADAIITSFISIVGIVLGSMLAIAYDLRSGIGFHLAFITVFNRFTSDLSLSAFRSHVDLASDSASPFAIFFYSSFFTSVWLWLYVTSGFAIKATRRIRFIWGRFSKYLDIDKKPLGCVGKVSALLVASLWAVFIGLEHALHYLAGH